MAQTDSAKTPAQTAATGQAALGLRELALAPASEVGGKLSDLLHMPVSACYPDEVPQERVPGERARYLRGRALEDWIEAEALWREMDWEGLAECPSAAFRGIKGLLTAVREASVNPAYPFRLRGPYVTYCGFFLLPDRKATAREMWSELAGFEIGDDCPLALGGTEHLRLAILLHEFCHAQQKYPVEDTPSTVWERELDCDRLCRAELLAAADALGGADPEEQARLRETAAAFLGVRALGALLRLTREYWFAPALEAEIRKEPDRPEFRDCVLAVEELRLRVYARLAETELHYTTEQIHAAIERTESAPDKDAREDGLDTFVRVARDYWWPAVADDDRPAPRFFAALGDVLAREQGLSPLARRMGLGALDAARLFCPSACPLPRPCGLVPAFDVPSPQS